MIRRGHRQRRVKEGVSPRSSLFEPKPQVVIVVPRRNLVPLFAILFATTMLACLAAGIRARPASAAITIAPSRALMVTRDEEPPPPEPAILEEEQEPPHSALDDREEARGLLSKRDLKGAIEAAQKSLEADAEDATTYLILGAAQMEALRATDAATTFRSCLTTAKRGPVAECRAFLR